MGITVENTNMKYRKKPVIIEAIQVLGTNDAEVKAFCPVVGADASFIVTGRNRLERHASCAVA